MQDKIITHKAADLHESLLEPIRDTNTFILSAYEEKTVRSIKWSVGNPVVPIRTGIRIEYDTSKILVFARNLSKYSMMPKRGCGIMGGFQTIHPDVEIILQMVNFNNYDEHITKGTFLAELLIMPVIEVEYVRGVELIG